MSIAAAFDSILATASMDMASFEWQGRVTFTVAVNGSAGRRTIRGRLAATTPDALRDALANALRDYCAIGAAELVAAA